ncbi:hypothetical protein P8C59_007550 [Phyllachora maydis]|uniref:Uncharacterized protein n=1 Tax=Phyllachora maydis TaxID=1825666 RepID=A0AAD9I9A5_9PEZI|nr:hypothetical protein P8C59_007550 [Phyllachora maydis]
MMMEQPFSTSKVTVEYHDPDGVYKLLAPGLIPRFPLRDLHWRSDSGNLRSIPSLHVDLLPAGTDFTSPAAVSPISSNPSSPYLQRSGKTSGREDGFLTASLGGRFPDPGDSLGSTLGSNLRPPGATRERRHQIPGLRRTPYLKILLVRCDDSDAYKSARAQIREWIKEHTPPSGGKSLSTTENHDAFEWMIVHVVIPNTAAFFQPRVSGSKASEATTDVSRNSTASRWRPGSSTLLEKLRGDFNTTSKGQVEDRVAQIRIGINDLPYDLLPRVVPAVPTGYAENDQDAENAWADLIGKFKDLILSSFNMRVSQYEDDIREKDAQRTLPGWNFCTFFILKEGLARGFESVGLVEDALRGYDELSVGLDTVLVEHAASASAGGVLLSYTEDLKDLAKDALSRVERGNSQYEDEESVRANAGGSFLRPGLEELASRRAELYALSRNILEDGGRKRGWNNGWESVPMVGDTGIVDMEDIGLDDDAAKLVDSSRSEAKRPVLLAGIGNELLRTALDSEGDFYRLYEILTDKALRHYTVAGHNHSVQACMADLAILKHHLGEFEAAASYLHRATPFFGELGWSLLELSMLIVYIKCLKELKRKDQYVAAIRKLLSQAAAAVKDKIAAKSSVRLGGKKNSTYLDTSVLSGYLGEFLSASNDMEESVRMPLENFFDELAIDAAPAYDPGQDSFSIILKYRSLFPESFEADKASLRMRPAAGGNREIWLHTRGPLHIKPGMNTIQPHSNDFTAGIFEVDEIFFASHNAVFYLKRDAAQPIEGGSVGVFRNPKVALFQRANCLDVRLMASREVQLDKNNTVDVQVLVGWNMITHCVVKIKPGTGGLRLLTHEAKVLGPNEPSRKPDGGVFTFGRIPEDSTVTIRLPFTVEQDVLHVSVKVEVVYSTDRGNFGFYKSPSVPIALVLGVNVQDVFKHAALFSRFTISTVTSSPLRLYESELAGSEVFDSHSGLVPSQAVMIFPKQPVSVMYKTTRKSGVKITHKTAKTMYLRLWYSVLLDEIEAVFEDTLTRELAEKSLWEYSKLVVSHVIGKLHNSLTDYDLEKIMLLGELQTTFLGDVRWESEFRALGAPLTASQLAKFMRDWQSTHRRLSVVAPIHRASKSSTAGEGSKLVRSIVIPVDIPSITIVHTADIRLQKPVAAISMADPDSGASAVCVNQVLPARLHLKWTRAWDTGDFDPATAAAMAPASPAAALAAKGGPSVHLTEDIEFSYEVTAPTDTWLLGGRRKGHFVIPGVADPNGLQGLTSTVSTEAVIALLLIPLREGWLPYPTVEIREVRSGTASMGPGGADGKDGLIAAGGGEGGGGGGGAQHGHCETDYRNLGETVRVVADRGRITLSLDASGPGGGPLVLESERLGLAGRVVA